MPRDAEHGIVALRSASRRVDEEIYSLVQDRVGGLLLKHDLDVGGTENLLVGVERQAAQLALDEVGAILHDGFELDMTIRALPAWHEMQHVHAGGGLSLFDALAAGQLHADAGEHGKTGDRVAHSHQTGVEVDLGRQGRDGDQTRIADQQEGCDRLIEEAGFNIRGLLQHDEVAARALGRGDLPEGDVLYQ